MKEVGIFNYGLGNISAFLNVYKRVGIDAFVCNDNDDLKKAKRLILPGVGSFDWALEKIENSGQRDLLNELIINTKIPVLGICVGFQIMTKKSEEGIKDGFGWIDCEVKKFEFSKPKEHLKLPHMGWNEIQIKKNNSDLMIGLEDSSFYFLHSYYVKANNQEDILSNTTYDLEFCSSLNYENIFGVQFHPEKSHHWGMKLLDNFAKI